MNQNLEAVERWARFVRDNPDKWKKIHTEFINAQYKKHREVLKKLSKETIMKLYNIKNKKFFKDED